MQATKFSKIHTKILLNGNITTKTLLYTSRFFQLRFFKHIAKISYKIMLYIVTMHQAHPHKYMVHSQIKFLSLN